MDPRYGTRVTAIILLAGGMLACAIDVAHFHRDGEPSASPANSTNDPLAAELLRCKALGTEAATDAACKDAWAKSRKRFFAPGTPYQGQPMEPFPRAPDLPAGPPAKDQIDRLPLPPPASGQTPGSNWDGR